jgi:hypothetical protein
MAISKTSAIDKIVIRSPYNFIELRTATVIDEDGVALAMTYSHEKLKLGELNTSDELIETDMSGYSTEIQGIAAAVWTDDIKTKYKEFLLADKNG